MESVNFIIAQIIGLMAIAIEVMSFQKNTKKQLLRLQIISCGMFGLQYLFLGAFSGAVVNFVCMLRNYLFNKFKKIPLYLILATLLVLIILSIITYDGPISLMPLLAIGTYTVSLYTGDLSKVRLAEVFGCIVMIIYNVVVLAITGIIATAIIMVATLISIARHDIAKPKKPSENH